MPRLLLAGVVIALWAQAITADAQVLEFSPHDYPAVSGARAAVAADFNRDGWMDIATANVGRNTVALLLNRGSGGGFLTREVTVAANPFGLAHGDINRDGVADLVVSSTTAPGSIDVVLLRSDGTVHARRLISGAGQPRGIVLADFTRDGRLDLAYADYAANLVRILRGDGSGAFPTTLGTFAVGRNPQGLAAGDFDHNGRIDLAVANTGSSSLSILIGTGLGTFAHRAVASGRILHELVAADLNADSWLDIAATSTSTNTVVFFAGSRGGFTRAGTQPTGAWPRGLTAGDVNHDGSLDVLVANRSSSTLTVLLGRTNGSVVPDTWGELLAGAGSRTAVTADFDHDGKFDVAVGAEYASGVRLLKNETAFAPAARTFRREAAPNPITSEENALADFNENGRADIAATNGVYLEGDRLVPLVREGFTRTAVAVGDINRDGHMDVVFPEFDADHSSVAGDGMAVYLGDGAGGFRNGPGVTGVLMARVYLGDVNRDGRLDVIGPGSGEPCPQFFCIIHIAINTGSGWALRSVVSDQGISELGLADMNRDGKLDVVSTEYDRVVVRHGDGTGNFGAPRGSAALDNTAGLLVLAHFDHDGIIDAAVDGFSLQVLLGRSDGTFAGVANYYPVNPGNPDWSTADLYVADFTQDGHIDVLGAGHLFEGRGDGSFEDVRRFTGFYGYGGVVVDWNRDGLPDVVEGRARFINQR